MFRLNSIRLFSEHRDALKFSLSTLKRLDHLEIQKIFIDDSTTSESHF